jgi:hypothetical protein
MRQATFPQYRVQAKDRKPLLEFMLDALRAEGCQIIYEPPPDQAPFRITFETRAGERLGIVAYAFLANSKLTKHRPEDEHRFQVKYGSKDDKHHTLWQDPYGLYVTLFLGINPEQGFFVAADPQLHNPTRFFISLEFKQIEVDQILQEDWHCWERDRRGNGASAEPVEVLVGGTASSFLRYIRFERDALGEDQGHRQLLAEKSQLALPVAGLMNPCLSLPEPSRIHQLTSEFQLSEQEVLDLISGARRLKMAVRGWVAEAHLVRLLERVEGVTDCQRIDAEGGPDVVLRYQQSREITFECKNVLRKTAADGTPRLDFQRTRTSKGDPCTRYYSRTDFDVVAACLHAITERWEYKLVRALALDSHRKCAGKINQNIRVDERWTSSAQSVLREIVGA